MKHETAKTVGFVLGGLFIIVALFYISFSVYFFSHFYFNSTVNGVESSGASAGDVAKKIRKTGDDYSLTVKYRDGLETVHPDEIGLKINVTEDMIREVLREQNGFLWVKALFTPQEYKSFTLVEYDPKLLEERAKNLEAVKNTKVIMTEDARYEFDGQKYKIIDEVYGTNVDMEALNEKLKEAVSTLSPSIDMDADKCYYQPEITSEDEVLNNKVNTLNEKLAIDITYIMGDYDEQISKETINGWLAVNDDDTVEYNPFAVREYVSQRAEELNTVYKPKTLLTTGGTTVTVKGGTYGWKLDEEKEYEQLLADLEAGEPVKREMNFKQKAASHGENDYGNSYVEVNLTSQHVYLYVDGKLILDSDCVSGNESRGTITHPGAYYVLYKKKDAILRGRGYETPVNYWMPFHNGEGLHDATWRGAFGGNIYKTSGSHGCVNLPFSVAKNMFQYVDAGFPVLVYQMPGSETDAEKTAVDAVIAKINSIGTVTSESGAAINNARSSYDKLSDNLKSRVTNYGTLTAAEKEYGRVVGDALKKLQEQQQQPQPEPQPEPTPEPTPDPLQPAVEP